eukprot:TRINITY_DN17119_c0_g1_i10.p1 TRINITY_DN17119_c0_g1~~TRINITY_DN17119_c0_g1_i10.p1  ORF type:complete len:298 (-),score=37.04 TRINITY_DN17119_c0_g1_i10:121-1014(-)
MLLVVAIVNLYKMVYGRVGYSKIVSCCSSRVKIQQWRFNRREVCGGFLISYGTVGYQNKAFAMSASQSQVEKILTEVKWPDEFPLDSSAFGRYDETKDSGFYETPRFVAHIDEGAINALTKYYQQVFPPPEKQDVAMLDICSSWISHYPKDFKAERISGLGMNGEELAANPIFTDYDVHDLNEDPKLPYDDNTFDFVTNAVSVDYLTKPLQVFQEIHRVLKPGGSAIMSFSNRCFPTKAIAIWTSTDDLEHIYIVGSYFHYSVKGGFTKPEAIDISPPKGLFGGDPMYVVQAKKQIV